MPSSGVVALLRGLHMEAWRPKPRMLVLSLHGTLPQKAQAGFLPAGPKISGAA